MYSKFDHFSFVGMSNSESFLAKDDKKQLEFEVTPRPTLDFEHECEVTASNQEDDDRETENCGASVSSKELKSKTPSLGEFEASEDDNIDGFRTPTSLEHKIPLIKQCPPAPRKPRPSQSTKRKLTPNFGETLEFDLSEEVESMFTPIAQEDIGPTIKKARRDGTD